MIKGHSKSNQRGSHMGVGREGRGANPPWILKISEKTGCFLSFALDKPNFSTFGPPRKILEKSSSVPLEKILPTPVGSHTPSLKLQVKGTMHSQYNNSTSLVTESATLRFNPIHRVYGSWGCPVHVALLWIDKATVLLPARHCCRLRTMGARTHLLVAVQEQVARRHVRFMGVRRNCSRSESRHFAYHF